MTSPYYQYGMELDGGVTPHFYIGTAAGLTGASMGTPLAVSQWSHLAIVFNGSQAQFYVNGNLVSSQPHERDHHRAQLARSTSAPTSARRSSSTERSTT